MGHRVTPIFFRRQDHFLTMRYNTVLTAAPASRMVHPFVSGHPSKY
jgi:hypothetical protein